MYGGQTSHLPLKVNTAGVIPPIFASSLLHVPGHASRSSSTIAGSRSASRRHLHAGRLALQRVYVALIIFFCYFYTAVTFNPVDVADNMKKSAASSPASGRASARRSTSTAC